MYFHLISFGCMEFCVLCFVDLLVVANGRDPPLISPFSAPLQSPALHSISPSTTNSIASPPQVMQIVVIYKHHHLDEELVLAIALSSVAVALILLSIFVIWIYCRRSRICTNSNSEQSSDITRGISLAPIFSKFNSFKTSGRRTSLAMVEYSLLEWATNKFSESNIVKEGAFGLVYKACFDGGAVAAVKKLDCHRQDSEREFQNEIAVLGKIRHPNIISLSGYCIHGEKRFIVYEFMQNGSLAMQLHGPSQGSALTWQIRMKIALDSARGLEYLHEHCNVIHRDLKSSNILLDSEFNAKISDFGLAVTGVGQNKGNIKLSGTLGHVAPEYLLDGKLTEKSDVYSFGVVLLELLMGRKPVEKLAPSQCQNIVTLAMPQLADRSKLPTIVDPAIKDTMDLKHLYQVAAVAVLCVQPEPSYRPLITDVLHSLIPLVLVEHGGML